MQYAITADLHLRADAPERLANLEGIFKLLQARKVSQLIIAGDLFDQGYAGYRDLDGLLARYDSIQVTAIAGNHDPELSGGQFSAGNITVIPSPRAIHGKKGELSLLYLPYQAGKTMGETLDGSGVMEELQGRSWVLLSHGDFGPRRRGLSGNEEGYFPLTRNDLTRYKPIRTILGHIHKPSPPAGEVVYPGSPYPLDISETGRRRILLLDQRDGKLESLPLDFAPCNLLWTLFVLPDGNEQEQVQTALQQQLEALALPAGHAAKQTQIRVRLEICGCSTDRAAPEAAARAWFDKQTLDLESVRTEALRYSAAEQNLTALTRKFEQAVAALRIPPSEYPGDGEELLSAIRQSGLNCIYRIKE